MNIRMGIILGISIALIIVILRKAWSKTADKLSWDFDLTLAQYMKTNGLLCIIACVFINVMCANSMIFENKSMKLVILRVIILLIEISAIVIYNVTVFKESRKRLNNDIK